MAHSRYHVLFSDVGGVLGTNGWDSRLRRKVAEHFGCDHGAFESRHKLMFDSFERGYMCFDEYLRHVLFAEVRPFTVEHVRNFAFAESVPWPENMELLREVKRLNGLKLGLISNEGEGLTNHRVKAWKLRELADFLVFSYAVHMRKPDPAIWKLALGLAQADVSEAIYIDDRPMFAEIASELGFAAIHHTSLADTREQLRQLGLRVPES